MRYLIPILSLVVFVGCENGSSTQENGSSTQENGSSTQCVIPESLTGDWFCSRSDIKMTLNCNGTGSLKSGEPLLGVDRITRVDYFTQECTDVYGDYIPCLHIYTEKKNWFFTGDYLMLAEFDGTLQSGKNNYVFKRARYK